MFFKEWKEQDRWLDKDVVGIPLREPIYKGSRESKLSTGFYQPKEFIAHRKEHE